MDGSLNIRVKAWAVLSLLALSISMMLIFFGDVRISIDERSLGLGQALWLPALIGSCSSLWLLMTMTGARTTISLMISLISLAGAETCTLLLPYQGIEGLSWETGNGLPLSISFASLALTSVIWTATGMIDPPRQNWWTYGVALTATVAVGMILSYYHFGFLQGAMASALSAALIWGADYDRRLYPYGKRKVGRRYPVTLFMITFVAMPVLVLGVPYIML